MGGIDFVKLSGKDFMTKQGIGLDLGSKYEVRKLVLTTGGGGTNAAVTFARQGLKTACISFVADDPNGREIIDELNSEGVDVSLIQKHSGDFTAYSVILVDDSGERTILSYKGEGQHFDTKTVRFDALESDWLYIGSIGGHEDVLSKALAWASANQVKIVTDPGTKELSLGIEKLKPLLTQSAIVHMNREEAAELIGIDFADETGIFKKADELIPGIFIMSNGHDGVAVSDGKTIYRAGVPDSPVIERTGAGDAFTSGFVAEYTQSGDIAKAIQFATANASSVVTQYGSKAGILKQGDTGPWPLVEVKTADLD